ncbi:MAG TPA: flagellar hook capping FlgD N-terminal domain-containing protein [Acidobacteriaceae bacterium]|nr:flagellar hook capping FlgD N-terminal domain-containing protein [Acidobacteriaceae bacterium]
MQLTNQPNAAPPLQASSFASAASQSAGNSSSTAGSNPATATATITADDFLQLLVTELQNQDPTANTDPNEYVDQLVQVNSLQQQIQMNQTLDGGPTLTGGSSGVLQELAQINQTLDAGGASGSAAGGASVKSSSSPAHAQNATAAPGSVGGNLSAAGNPAMQASAEAVATALYAKPDRTAGAAENPALQIPASQMGAFAQFAERLRPGQQAQP